MIPKGLFSQIAIILLSGLIIFTYVKPSLLATKTIQDKITLYQQQRQKVSTVNGKLATLKSSVDTVGEDDKHRLLTYMPNTVDTIAVPRDLTFIADEAGVVVNDIKYVGLQKPIVGEATIVSPDGVPDMHVFELSVQGSYTQIKQLLVDLEQNAYPLEVHDLKMAKREGGFLTASLKIYTYNRAFPAKDAGTI
jgi:hypothetical protein